MLLINDFQAEPEALIQAQVVAAERVIRSGWYILGQEVKAFEHAWAQRCGAAYALGLGNGMDAIEIGLRTLGIALGDEVITTPMTAFATVLAILRAGATPVLADIDPTTALLDQASVERCRSARTKALLLVHLYGQMRGMDDWQRFCQTHSLHLLEDCAQSHLATWQAEGEEKSGEKKSGEQKSGGCWGAWGAYSFYPTKNLGALGDGGALVTNSQEIAEQTSRLRNYGQSVRYHHPELGLNSRLDEMQAALLRVRLDWLGAFTQRRREIAQIYFEQIDNPHVQILATPAQAESHVYHLFVITCAERDRLSSHLKEQGVQSLIHYPIPVHRQPPCSQMRCDPLGLPNAEAHAQRCLTLPCHPQMSDVDVQQVIEAVNSFRLIAQS